MEEIFRPAMPDFRNLTLIYPADEEKPPFTLRVPREVPLPSAIMCHGLLFRQDDHIEDAYWMQYSSGVEPFRESHGVVVFFHPRLPTAT